MSVATNTTETETEKKFTLADVESRFVTLDENGEMTADDAVYLSNVEAVAKAAKQFRTNLTEDRPIPAGFGLYVLPISKRGAEGNETIGACVAAVPTLETIAGYGADENGDNAGPNFIEDAVLKALAVKIANAVRPRADGTVSGTIPYTLADFIEKRTKGEGFKTFNTISAAWVKALRAKGLKLLTAGLLRQALSSKILAERYFPAVKQDSWQFILKQMITHAEHLKLDPAILVEWLNTRDTVTEEEMELDFSDIGSIVGEQAAE